MPEQAASFLRVFCLLMRVAADERFASRSVDERFARVDGGGMIRGGRGVVGRDERNNKMEAKNKNVKLLNK